MTRSNGPCVPKRKIGSSQSSVCSGTSGPALLRWRDEQLPDRESVVERPDPVDVPPRAGPTSVEELSHDALADDLAAFADGEVQADLAPDRHEEIDLHGCVVARLHVAPLPRQRDSPARVAGP